MPLAVARTVYIRDTLYVPLRSGQSEQYRIVDKGLKSGTPLELLDTNTDTGYSHVRTQQGVEGWIQSQYLVDAPIAKDQLKDVNDKLTKLEADHQKTLLHVQDLQSQRDSLSKDLNDTKAKFEDMKKRFEHIQAMSANVVKINKRNDELKANEERLKAQIQQLSESNHKLKDTSNRAWFVRGGALVLIALLIGLLVGRRLYNRRNSGWA